MIYHILLRSKAQGNLPDRKVKINFHLRFKSITSLFSSFILYYLSMICVIWNVRKIGNDAFIARVKRLIVDNLLSFLCLLEPLVDSFKQSEIARNIVLNNSLVIVITKFDFFMSFS